jgi:hypothetical protein
MAYRSAAFKFGVVLLTAVAPLCAQSKYKAPKTPWGDPDLQGYYLNRSTTPLERPQNLGAKEVYTPEELKAREEAAANRPRQETQPGTQEDAHYDMNQFGLDAGTTGTVRNPRTSLITGPTGRLPQMLPAATKRVADQRAAARGHEMDGPENRGMAERCILWNFEGPPLMPGGYNPNVQIFQGPGVVAIRNEMMGGARVVRIGSANPPHLDPHVRHWYGDSVGHWEGETLVVDSTNFNDQPALGRGATSNLHVVERFTRTADDQILYQFTVSDPSTWEQSWSGEYPIQKIQGPIYEYGCQEGNYGMPNILSGARAAEREAAAAKKQ